MPKWKIDIPGPDFAFEGVKWPLERMHSIALRRLIEARGLLSRASLDRSLLLKVVNHVCIENASKYPILPSNVFIRGMGKFIALNLLIPKDGVVFQNDPVFITSTVSATLPKINDDFFTNVFDKRPGVRRRAKACVNGGFVTSSKIKIATGVELQTP